VSAGLMTVLLALGAGALALWVDMRFPRLEPRELRLKFLAHIFAVPLALALIAPAGLHLMTRTTHLPVKVAGLIGIALPCLIYAFLVTVWILKLVQRTAGSSIR
jgi:hypothetical protein